jgi:hydroxymethylglutaryl-CoA lyase
MLLEHMGCATGIELDALMRASDLARELTGTAPGGRASAWIRQELERRARAD